MLQQIKLKNTILKLRQHDVLALPSVQWPRLSAPNAGSLGLIPGEENRSHMLQLRVHMLQVK